MRRSGPSKLIPLSRIASLSKRLRRSGKKIVFTNGCFDILHVGHIRYLRRAKRLGDVLVLGLNSDRSVRRLKGRGRPLVSQKERAEILSALESVDYLVIFKDPTPLKLIQKVQPRFLVKGGDWPAHRIVGHAFVRSTGGSVRSLRFEPGRSTSALIRKVKKAL